MLEYKNKYSKTQKNVPLQEVRYVWLNTGTEKTEFIPEAAKLGDLYFYIFITSNC